MLTTWGKSVAQVVANPHGHQRVYVPVVTTLTDLVFINGLQYKNPLMWL